MIGIKKIFLIILALLTLSSCAQGDLAAGGGSVTTPPAADSAETEDVQPDEPPETEPDISLPVETEPEEVVAEPIEEEFILKKRMYFRVPAEEVDAEAIEYSSYNARGELITENDMYYPKVFCGDDVYYILSAEDPYCFEYYRFNIESGESEFIFEVPFGMADEAFEVVNGFLICGPGDHDENGQLVITVYSYDIDADTGEPEVILSVPAATPQFNISRLNDKEVVFFVYEEIDGKTADMVYRYNTETKELSVFYENHEDDWTDAALTTRNVDLMTVHDEKVYLLMYQGIDGEIVYSVDVYDAGGGKIAEYDLDVLDRIYRSYPDNEALAMAGKNGSVDDIYIFDDYAVIFNWYLIMDDNITGEFQRRVGNPWEIIVCRLDGDSYMDLGIGEYEPQLIGYHGSPDDRYLVMASKNEDIDLIIIDTQDGVLTPIELDIPENIRFNYDAIAMNELGDIIMVGEDENEDNKKMYIVSLDDIVATVEKYQSDWVMM